MSSARCLVIAGAGDLGMRLARQQCAQGVDVIAVRRRDVATEQGVRSLRVDLATGEGLGRLPRRPDAVVFCAAPDSRDEAGYRALFVDGIRRLLDAVETPRLLFVSSTSVYAEQSGEWVDEQTPAGSEFFNGRVLLQAESELRPHPGAVAVRLSGLYGPGRDALLQRARSGLASRRQWSNRIHVHDAASALSHLLVLPEPQRLYLGSDDEPALEWQVQAWLRDREQLPALAADDGPETGRRIRNQRLRASGWQPRYPDFRNGYTELLEASGL